MPVLASPTPLTLSLEEKAAALADFFRGDEDRELTSPARIRAEVDRLVRKHGIAAVRNAAAGLSRPSAAADEWVAWCRTAVAAAYGAGNGK